MAKKQKGKQKQDEPTIINNQTKDEQVNVSVIPDDKLHVNSFVENPDNTWGPTSPATWGVTPDAGIQGEPWPAQEENWPAQESEAWDSTAEALLQPPSNQSHNGLPTIHEQPSSGNFAQNGAVLSEIEESPDEYDQSWHNSDANSAQSQTVTATAPSFRGSPTLPPLQSNFVLEEAMKAVKSQGTSTASEAARKMEKAKAVQFREPDITAQVERSNPQVAAHQGSSSASAAAFAAESSRKQTHAPTSGQKASNSKTIPWTYPKPGTRNLAPMPIDPSWIATGGNEWSNKHRNGFQNPNWSPGDEYLRTQHLSQPQFQQQAQFQQHPQHAQQARQSQHAQRPQVHQRHHSHPIQSQTHQSQSIRPLYKGQAKQRQDWQDWGKGQVDELIETESDGETATGWETSDLHECDQWGQSQVRGKKQNTTGGEWGQGVVGRVQNGLGAGNQNEWGQNAGGGLSQGAWDQSAEEWGGRGTGDTLGQSAGGWAQEPTNLKKDDRKRKSHPKKGGDERGQGGDTWNQGHEMTGQKRQKGQKQQGNAWGETNDAWQQESIQRQTQDAWGETNDAWQQESTQRQTQDAWGQDTNYQGGQGDAWGQGLSIRGQNTKHQGGQGGDAWGQGVSIRGQNTNHRGGQGGDAWGQGVSTRGQDTNHQGSQGGEAWGQGSTWGQDTDNRKTAGEWAGGTSSNAAWGDEAQRLPKVTSTVPPEAVGSRNVLSPQQRSQILSNLLNQPQTQNVKIAQSAMKHGAQKKKTEHEQWGAWEAHDHGWGSEDEDDVDDIRRVRFSPKASELWGESPRSIPSKTLARAQQGMTTIPINDPNTVRFLESKGAAFEYVTNAFFGNSRFARERIHWLFPSDKDPRVAAMLAWVQKLSYNLGTFGLIKFLQHRERGGLFINAIFRMRHNPQEPALDWLTFKELQGTMDKALQESVAFYDPSTHVMVFVYLPSESGNSIAIWRLKINVPDKTRSKYQAEIAAMTKILPKHAEYVVIVDERPPKKKKPAQKTTVLRKNSLKKLPGQPKEKRKWWQVLFS